MSQRRGRLAARGFEASHRADDAGLSHRDPADVAAPTAEADRRRAQRRHPASASSRAGLKPASVMALSSAGVFRMPASRNARLMAFTSSAVSAAGL